MQHIVHALYTMHLLQEMHVQAIYREPYPKEMSRIAQNRFFFKDKLSSQMYLQHRVKTWFWAGKNH